MPKQVISQEKVAHLQTARLESTSQAAALGNLRTLQLTPRESIVFHSYYFKVPVSTIRVHLLKILVAVYSQLDAMLHFY